jgi:hypothetical protein
LGQTGTATFKIAENLKVGTGSGDQTKTFILDKENTHELI